MADSSDGTVAVDSAGIVIFTLNGNPLGQAFTDTTGSARIEVNPGTYLVQLSSCPGAAQIPDGQTTQVIPGEFTVVNFLCSTAQQRGGVLAPR